MKFDEPKNNKHMENNNQTLTTIVTKDATAFYNSVTKGSQVLLEKLFPKMDNKQIFSAIIEARALGFTEKDFLSKKVYAVPFGQSYSLVTSIDDARSKADSTGDYAGSTGGEYTYTSSGVINTCTVTVKKFVKGIICDFTATVFFNEYYSGNKNPDGTVKTGKYGPLKETLWDSKSHTMIAKVAEMHALRKAFPDTIKLYDVAEMPASGTITVDNTTQDVKFETEKDEEPEVMTPEDLPSEEINSMDTIQ
jgi:hypothetical protein